jgi:hypothetical protein
MNRGNIRRENLLADLEILYEILTKYKDVKKFNINRLLSQLDDMLPGLMDDEMFYVLPRPSDFAQRLKNIAEFVFKHKDELDNELFQRKFHDECKNYNCNIMSPKRKSRKVRKSPKVRKSRKARKSSNIRKPSNIRKSRKLRKSKVRKSRKVRKSSKLLL